MSQSHLTYGAVIVLAKIVNKETIEEINDLHYDDKSKVFLNYEGTLAFYDSSQKDDYSGCMSIISSQVPSDLLDFLEDHGIEYREEVCLPFVSVWYDGSDSPMKDMTIADAMVRIL